MRIAFLAILFPLFYSSQVIIGSGKTTLTNNSVSLEFGNEAKGIILPYVTNTSAVANVAPGTLVFDSSDFKIKVKLAKSWNDLSVDTTGKADLAMQNKHLEKINAKVSVGKPTNTPGILVLEDFDKAMILPLVNTYKDIKNPSAGMLAYDTTLKMLCVYNGSVWSFWKG